MRFAPEALEAAFAEARRCWPREACGIFVGRPGELARSYFVAFENMQDRLHAADPVSFPRDARTAYSMDALRLERFVDAAVARGEQLLAIIHSHPQHPSYFSRTDRAAACPFGFPTYPDALQIVISVYDRVVHDLKAFRWEG
jgi:proteasome lid subunit RPN8/RPN11